MDAIAQLGVCFLKLAQVLATRADFFPLEYLDKLKTIHDQVSPMNAEEYEKVFARAFPDPSCFSFFDSAPLASASIGQVHEARLQSGERVAVKLRRQGVDRLVEKDIRLLRGILWLAQPLFSRLTRNSLEAVISEFSDMIRRETDMLSECENLEQFRKRFVKSDVTLPEAYRELTSSDALVMSFIDGVRIDDKEAIGAMGIDGEKLISKLVVFYMEQMLIAGFFHADPHPGNLLVQKGGRLALLDFGMVKRLSNATRIAMIEVVKAANERDFELYILACKRLGVVAADAPDDKMTEFAERIFDIFGDARLSASSMRDIAFTTLASMRDLPFKIPQEVVYVMRVSSLIEGLGTTFVDNFNGVKDVLPVLKSNLTRALGAEAGLFPTIGQELAGLPLTMRRAKTVFNDLAEQNLHVKLSRETLDLLEGRIRNMMRPICQGGLFILAAFLVVGMELPWKNEIAVLLFAVGALRIVIGLK